MKGSAKPALVPVKVGVCQPVGHDSKCQNHVGLNGRKTKLEAEESENCRDQWYDGIENFHKEMDGLSPEPFGDRFIEFEKIEKALDDEVPNTLQPVHQRDKQVLEDRMSPGCCGIHESIGERSTVVGLPDKRFAS